MNDKQAKSKFQGVSPVEKRQAKEDRNEEKGEFSAACGIEKKLVREESEENENESEDGVVEHSKVQALESRKICQKF